MDSGMEGGWNILGKKSGMRECRVNDKVYVGGRVTRKEGGGRERGWKEGKGEERKGCREKSGE